MTLDFLSAIMAGSVFALACNLDTVLASVGQGARGEELTFSKALAVAGLTTVVTFLSLLLGAVGATFLPEGLAGRLGGLSLTALGLWYLLDALRGRGEAPPQGKGWVALSAALAVNNAGVGVAAGVTGLSPAVASGCNFLATLLALWLGGHLGRYLADWSHLALPASGLLLVLLGLWQVVC